MTRETTSSGRPRVEFEVPTGSRRSACKYCGAALFWIHGYRGPLDAASALTGDDGRRWCESHIPHCRRAPEALARSRTAECSARGCQARVPRGRVFCPSCWKLLPDSIQSWLRRAWSQSPRGAKWDEALAHAASLADQLRTRAKHKPKLRTGLLFRDEGAAPDLRGDH